MNTGNTVNGTTTQYRFNAEKLSDAANYAQRCYGDSNFGNTACNKYVVRHLPAVVNNSAKCPFDSHICRSPEANILLDTGYIDSNNDLGLNRPEDKRFSWRQVMHCAPLVTEGYTSEVSTPEGNWTRYHYGTTPRGAVGNQTFTDYLFEAKSMDLQYPNTTAEQDRSQANLILL
jgi:hypothetical protein